MFPGNVAAVCEPARRRCRGISARCDAGRSGVQSARPARRSSAATRVRVLRDAAENYPAWERAIDRRDARRSTSRCTSFIATHGPAVRRPAGAQGARGRHGAVIYDWFGCGSAPLLGLFRPLIARRRRGARRSTRRRFDVALGWVRRNHRKLIIVDGRVAFVSGLCIGEHVGGMTRREPRALARHRRRDHRARRRACRTGVRRELAVRRRRAPIPTSCRAPKRVAPPGACSCA